MGFRTDQATTISGRVPACPLYFLPAARAGKG